MSTWWDRLRRLARPEVELLDIAPELAVPMPRLVLRRIAAEAIILQDRAEQVLGQIRRHTPLGTVAPQAGPLVRRFFALRDTLPTCTGPDDVRIRRALDVVLHHHAMVLATAQELLAYEWRSEEIRRQVETFDGLGAPARLLEEVYAELATVPVAISPAASTAR